MGSTTANKYLVQIRVIRGILNLVELFFPVS